MTATIGQSALSAQSTPSAAPKIPDKPAAPPLADDLRRRVQSARDSVDLRATMAQQRKALARQAVEGLKKQMDKLALVAALNPEGVARVLNGMAKQLAGAARQYQEAGDAKDLKAEGERIEEFARDLEGRAEPGTPAPPPAEARRSSLAQAYRDLDPPEKKADEAFLVQVDGLRRRMDGMFEAMARRAVAEGANREDMEELVADFEANRAIILRAQSTIAGWWRPGG